MATLQDLAPIIESLLRLRESSDLQTRLTAEQDADLLSHGSPTEVLAIANSALKHAQGLKEPLCSIYKDRLQRLIVGIKGQLRHRYDQLVPESQCGCSEPRITHNLDGAALCQCCGKMLSDDIAPLAPIPRQRDGQFRSQIDYFNKLVASMLGERSPEVFREDEIGQIQKRIFDELRVPSNTHWRTELTAPFLRTVLRDENLPQYYPWMIPLYMRIVGKLPYEKPQRFRETLMEAFRVYLEVQAEYCPTRRQDYKFVLYTLLRTIYPSHQEIEKLMSFYQFDEQTFTSARKAQWNKMRVPFLAAHRLKQVG